MVQEGKEEGIHNERKDEVTLERPTNQLWGFFEDGIFTVYSEGTESHLF